MASGVYTARFNRRHKLFGHVFSGRYKALIVDGSSNGYLKTVCDYVHLNPVRAKLLGSEQRLTDYQWSSWRGYLTRAGKRPVWLSVGRLLGEYQIPKDSPAGQRRLEECLEERRASETGVNYKGIRRGWFLGDKTLKRELLEQMRGGFGAHHEGEEKWESAEGHAQELVTSELQRLGWHEEDLELRSKGDPGKVRIARRLRTESTMTLKWIGKRLSMGSVSMVKYCLETQR